MLGSAARTGRRRPLPCATGSRRTGGLQWGTVLTDPRDHRDTSPQNPATPGSPGRSGSPADEGGQGPEQLSVPVLRLDPEFELPRAAKPGDAGMDLRASEAVVIPPGRRALVGTGLAIALPDGWVGLVHPRSGLAAKHGITVLNAPGTIDSGYRGEIRVTLLNTDLDEAFAVAPGDRIAQLVVQRAARVELIEVDRLEDSERGDTGFGSSGAR